MNEATVKLVREKFAQYYSEPSSVAKAPVPIDQREFGFLLFREGFMLRHKKFEDVNKLQSFLAASAPSDVYYSSAFYENPEAEMERKGWLGADLIFDIDADHIPTACNKIHDTWICGTCGFAGRGIVPKNCPACGESKIASKTWPCEVCLENAKSETLKLLDILAGDFGFSPNEVTVAFSGHRGYHVHVENEAVKSLDQAARKEIVDYVIGLGLETSLPGLDAKSGAKASQGFRGPSLNDLGWRGRVARGTCEILGKATEEELKNMGLSPQAVDALLRNKAFLEKSWSMNGPWNAIKGIGVESWRKIIKHVIEAQAAKIDTVVTTDVHRLIRLAGSLHGKTALKKLECPLSSVEGFDPLKSAVAFHKGTITINITEAPKLRIGDETFGPYKNAKAELPTAAALFLLCKNAAEVEE